MSELHLNHYDDESFFTVEAYDSEAQHTLATLGATHVRDNLYRLPVAQVVPFLAQRFKLDVAGFVHRHLTDEQREARRQNMAAARAKRWAKTTS